MVCQRSPSGYRSGFDAWNGSSNASTAVSNDKPCLTRFAAALFGSHVQRTAASLCSYKYGVTQGDVKGPSQHIVAEAFENTASSRRLPHETPAVRRPDREHR